MNGRDGVNGISVGAFDDAIAVKTIVLAANAIPKGGFANVKAAFVSIVSAIG